MQELFSTLPESTRPEPGPAPPRDTAQPPPAMPRPTVAGRALWLTSIVAKCFARVFAPIPPEPIWQWAETNVFLKNEVTAKPGFYSSHQTPWTRRLQDLIRDAVTVVYDHARERFQFVPVRRVWVKKCSQSGFSEACLNGIRWSAKYRPRSTIFAIDSMKEARNISERLSSTLARLGENVFAGDDPDVGTFVMRLKAMRIYFLGSFSAGAFANKFASMCFADECDEHGKLPGDTDTLTNLESRAKTADSGFIVGLSKPKRTKGPITRVHAQGNCEEFFVECPHCHERQVLTFFGDKSERPEIRLEIPYADEVIEVEDAQTGVVFRTWAPLPPGQVRTIRAGKIRFDHCRDLLGAWDKVAILADTYFECGYCAARIDERHKKAMVAAGEWLPTALGTPGVISQHISDLYSSDAASRWGQIVMDFLDAKNDRTKLQGFWNHRLGLDFKEDASELGSDDIKRNVHAYKRGTVPFEPVALFLGADVGLEYARWVVCALGPDGTLAVVDWGNEGSPGAVAEIVIEKSWPERAHPDKSHKVTLGLLDAKYRKRTCEVACLATNGRMFPAMGGGSNTQRRAFTWNKYEKGMPKWFGYCTFNDHDVKSSLYLDRFKKRAPAILFPEDIFKDPQFCEEITKESLIEDEDGHAEWDNKHPNHYGDSLKLCDLAFRLATKPRKADAAKASLHKDAEPDPEGPALTLPSSK